MPADDPGDIAAEFEGVDEVAIRVAHELVVLHAEDGAGGPLFGLANDRQPLAGHFRVFAALVALRNDDVGDFATGGGPAGDGPRDHEFGIVGVGDDDHRGGWDKVFDVRGHGGGLRCVGS